jgi:hypothetical protein
MIDDFDHAIDQALERKSKGVAKSIGVPANAVDLIIFPRAPATPRPGVGP